MMTHLFETVKQLITENIFGVQLTVPLVLCFCLAASIGYSYYLSNRYSPPGPPRLPLLGNIFQMPRKMQFLKFTEWGERYGMSFHIVRTLLWWTSPTGPIVSFKVFGQNVIVLNTHKAATDLFGMLSVIWCLDIILYTLLERRSNIYSSRPRLVMAGEILTGNASIPLLGYGDLCVSLRSCAYT
jgi:hypothetical protein